MSTLRTATERSPLLGRDRRHRPTDVSSSTSAATSASSGIKAIDNGSAPNNVTNKADIERREEPSEEDDLETLRTARSIKYILPVLAIGILLAFLDQSIVFAINGNIGSDLHALENVSWIATGYFLSMTCSQPLYGKLSDIFGRKPCLLFAYSLFGLGSLGCGLARTMTTLIASRVVQGIGGGGMSIVVTVLLSDFIPTRERGTWQGYLNLIGALGSTSGAPLGGIIVQNTSWRWAFLGQVPLCLLAIIAAGFFLHLPKRQDQLAWTKQLQRIDFLGAVLLVATVFALLFSLDRGINVSWRSPYAIAFTCATLPLIAGFLLVETKFATEPFTPGHIMFNRALFVCYACNFFGYAAFTAFGFYIPLFLQVVLQMSPAQSGAIMIPLAISAVVGTLLGGIIIKRTGKFYWLGVSAGITGTLGSLLIAWAAGQGRNSLPGIYSGSILSFIPQGMVVTASLIAILSNVSSEDQAIATACSFLSRSLGSAVGVSLCGVLIQSVLDTQLHLHLNGQEADHITERIRQSIEYIQEYPEEIRIIIRECYGTAIQAGFVFCSCALAAAAFSVFWWRAKRLGH